MDSSTSNGCSTTSSSHVVPRRPFGETKGVYFTGKPSASYVKRGNPLLRLYPKTRPVGGERLGRKFFQCAPARSVARNRNRSGALLNICIIKTPFMQIRARFLLATTALSMNAAGHPSRLRSGSMFFSQHVSAFAGTPEVVSVRDPQDAASGPGRCGRLPLSLRASSQLFQGRYPQMSENSFCDRNMLSSRHRKPRSAPPP